ncbi:protein-disulfide reductase DsbD domain-containing protein [Mucilaginibacter sp. SG564]|uniref:protein-disulfide reductase DsbD domain-containing protein n=1 Tax=Mucilaginibacter sp. SG564 TaxID=2587022 RepID=UPI0015576136|nr:protein-disulfide reductase DsbD domain-containing protein [Mucilaginibacter sp. SG564]NOW95036.1 hypothetical protein [Mucilaginibacter sp. SG564]
MKNLFSTLLFIAVVSVTQAQIVKPVSWSFGVKKTSATEAVVMFKATIDNGWHIYSQHVKDGGPVKTSFTFKSSPDYTLIGSTTESKSITRREEAFHMDVSFFENKVIFQQKIRIKKRQMTVNGTLEYMTCNDHQCLPPEDIDFSVAVK